MDPVTAAVNEAIDEVIGRVGEAARVAVACSGGADSMALAHATLRALGAGRVVVVHVDHQLSAGSSTIAGGVAAWARGQGAGVEVRQVSVDDRASLEAAARAARYAALADVADELALTTIFVGHTARDQAETVLMRIVRGTGPAGLAGIPRARVAHEQHCAMAADHAAADAPWIVRPLLGVDRDAVAAYVATHALPTWDDPMNIDRAVFRVRVRDEILPALRRENPQLDQALLRIAASAAEWLAVIDGLAAPLAVTPIACAALAAQPPAVRKRAIALALDRAGVGYEAVHLDAIDALVVRPAAGQVAIDLPAARVVRTYDALVIEAGSVGAPETELVAPAGYLVRRWAPGDRMCPARLGGRSRKLSDLFIDAKIPRDMRSRARVVVRPDGVIVWAEHLGLAHQETENVVPRPPE